ncbi:MAG: fumarylacetoacetase [Hyphomicrobiaceae bacterium]|nr:MAG: fumarylacetoacetase [Hyphomicrobiaceae bacterium]
MPALNATHDSNLKSWIATANAEGCSFPIQNLPFGVFSTADRSAPRIGVAIGDRILDLAVIEEAGLVRPRDGSPVFASSSLNSFMGLGPAIWSRTRARLSALLATGNAELRDSEVLRSKALISQSTAVLHLPIDVRGYTDFYASKEHATNVGRMFRDPDNALLPNWLHIPIAYNGRASTVVVSGTPVRRPLGQIKLPGTDAPVLASSRKLDFELEIGAIVGTASPMGRPLTMSNAEAAIFGYVLLNDWSARDIQQWEYVPLGPFQSKAFATSISPWVVTAEALQPFRVAGPKQVPEPLPYLRQSQPNNYDIQLEVTLEPEHHDARATTICRTNFKDMYWSSAQQLAHHALCGCAMQVGDLLGSGTISGADPASYGSMLELSWNGSRPIHLAGGGERCFLEDGDEIAISGWSQGDGFRIGFGEVRSRVLPAHPV